MDLSKFVENVKKQDSRNKFGKGTDKLNSIISLFTLYKLADPVDVEINVEGMIVKLFPINQLEKIQREYKLEHIQLVFASSEGDPIYINRDGKICICEHGVSAVNEEVLAESFDEFIKLIG